MNADEISAALQTVFDQAIMFHAFTDYMRDYEIITYATADPITRIPPRYDRFLFRHCVEAHVVTTVPPDVWIRSLDDQLVASTEARMDSPGYVWGVKWQCVYPGGSVVANSETARRWRDTVGIPFHEVRIETNAHDIRLVFSDLQVSILDHGHTPFVVGEENHYVPPTPLPPD
jgi:hypothetical protein